MAIVAFVRQLGKRLLESHRVPCFDGFVDRNRYLLQTSHVRAGHVGVKARRLFEARLELSQFVISQEPIPEIGGIPNFCMSQLNDGHHIGEAWHVAGGALRRPVLRCDWEAGDEECEHRTRKRLQ